MSRSAILLLLLAACAAPQQRREFRDGAPVRAAPVEPRTTYTPPGTGLSEYWCDPEAPKPERSPYKRVLPQTPETMKEPGIWASDRPHAAVDGPPRLFGMTMPHSLDAKDWPLGNECSFALEFAATRSGLAQRLAAATERVRLCIAASMFHSCAEFMAMEWAKAHSANQAPDVEREHLIADRLKWLSADFADKTCRDVKAPDEMWDDSRAAEIEAFKMVTNSHKWSIQ